jgi:FKBP-type peptidyl-prolyl cis-trans isomerase SlyD
MQVQKNTVVTIRYIMKDVQGNIMEDTMNHAAVQYVHGSGNILESLESELEGMTAGAERSFEVHEKLWKNPLHFDLVVDEIRPATAEEIEKGQPNKKECGPGCNC